MVRVVWHDLQSAHSPGKPIEPLKGDRRFSRWQSDRRRQPQTLVIDSRLVDALPQRAISCR
jgi:hypothetical protein